jgi:L-rhamnose mutarotase
MKIKPGVEKEYKRRHDEIWPEMAKVLKQAGISNYSIFLKDDLTLFAYLEVEDLEKQKALSKNPTVRKWWDYMADIMEVNPDNSPVAKDLKQVFFLE